jgi:hypothetical protein
LDAPRANGSPRRVVRRRAGLPGSRAVVGGLLVAVAAVGLYAASSQAGGDPRHSYVVARHALAAGARLQPGDLTLAAMDLSPATRSRAFDDRAALVGATLVAPLAEGELLQASTVVPGRGSPGSRELSFTVDRGHLTPALKEGERADVLATYGTGNDAFTTVVVRQALLVGLQSTRSSDESGPVTVTVSLDDPADTLALAHATQLAKVTLVRATGAPPIAGVPPTYRVGRT